MSGRRLFPLSVNSPFDQLQIRCLGRALWEFEPSHSKSDDSRAVQHLIAIPITCFFPRNLLIYLIPIQP